MNGYTSHSMSLSSYTSTLWIALAAVALPSSH